MITKTKTGFPALGAGVLQLVVDNGEPGAESSTPDTSQTYLAGAPLTVCPDSVIEPGFNVDQGHYVVHDASSIE